MEKSSFYSWKLLLILSSISILVMYVETMLLPAIPDIISEFNISYSMSSWIFASFVISALISTTIVSKLSDLYGRKRILLTVLVIYTIGILGGSLANDIFWLIFFRIIQGIGMSVFPLVFAIIQIEFPKEKIAISQGTLASMFAFGGVLGLMIGGNITHNFGWHMTFLSILPFTIIVTIVIKYFVRIQNKSPVVKEANKLELSNEITSLNSDQRHTKFSKVVSNFDIKGTIALAVTIISFILALTLVQSENNESVESGISISTLLFALSGVSLFIFILLERKASVPLISLQLIKLKPIFLTNIIILIWGIATFTIFQTIPVLVRTPQPIGFGGSALDVVYLTLPFSIMSLIFGPTSGFIISKIGSFRVIIAGSIIATIGFSSILLLYNNLVWTAVSLAIIGSGLSLLNVGQININTTSTPIKFIGISFGVNTLFRFIGSAIGPAIAGMLMQTNQTPLKINYTNNIIYFPSSNSFIEIFFCMSLLVFISLILSAMIKRDRIQLKT